MKASFNRGQRLKKDAFSEKGFWQRRCTQRCAMALRTNYLPLTLYRFLPFKGGR